MLSSLVLLCSVGFGPFNGVPGSMDAVHNLAQPESMRTYSMAASIVCFFVGNSSAGNSATELAAEGRFGAVGIGWQLAAVASNFTGLEANEIAAASALKIRHPAIKTLVTRNSDCGGLNWDTVRVAVAAHPEWFLRDRNGAVFYVPWVANDPTFFGHENFWYPSPYWNFSVPAATDWWLKSYIGDAVDNDLFDGIYWDACGPQAPPVRQVNYPCPGRGPPHPEPDCKYPRALEMSGAEQATYYGAAQTAFRRAEALIAGAGKWSTTWMGEGFSNQTCCRGCKPECRPATTAECVEKVVALVETASQPNHTLQLRVPLPVWTAQHRPPFAGGYLADWVALFLLVRGESAVLYFPGQGGAFSYAEDYPAWDAALSVDYGVPVAPAPTLGRSAAGVPLATFTREWSRATVTLDCTDFSFAVTSKHAV